MPATNQADQEEILDFCGFLQATEEASCAQTLVLMQTLTTPVSTRRITQQSTSNWGCFRSVLMMTFWYQWSSSQQGRMLCWTFDLQQKKNQAGVLWFNSHRQLSPMLLLTHTPPTGMRERVRRSKVIFKICSLRYRHLNKGWEKRGRKKTLNKNTQKQWLTTSQLILR